MSISYDEAEMLMHIARDATVGESFDARLRTVTDHLALLVPNTAVTAMVVGPQGPSHLLARNVSSSELETYAADYMRHDPMVLSGSFGRAGLVVTLSDFVSDRDFGRDAFTGEFFPRLGLRFQLATCSHMPDGALLSLAISRDRALGDFSPKERQLISLIYPDLSRAAFATLLQEKVAKLARGTSLTSNEGAMVFDARGDLLQADDGALGIAALLGGGQGRAPADLFVGEVRRMTTRGVGAISELTIPLAGGGRAHLRFDVVAHASEKRVIAQLRVDRAASPERLAAFAARYRLTIRERDVAALAAEGLGNRHIGHKLGISEVTVGVYLTKVYRKTGATNRTELAKVLLEAP